jgi:hypothetical protein
VDGCCDVDRRSLDGLHSHTISNGCTIDYSGQHMHDIPKNDDCCCSVMAVVMAVVMCKKAVEIEDFLAVEEHSELTVELEVVRN